jgi:hypothetical protein
MQLVCLSCIFLGKKYNLYVRVAHFLGKMQIVCSSCTFLGKNATHKFELHIPSKKVQLVLKLSWYLHIFSRIVIFLRIV